jgi:Rhs element Vgr protein
MADKPTQKYLTDFSPFLKKLSMQAVNTIQSGGIVTFEIKVGGKSIPDESRVLSVYVANKINGIPEARISFLDGEPDTGTFEVSSSSTFVPGAEISIASGYDSKNSVIFRGIVTGQSIRIDQVQGSVLEVLCKDAAIRMTVGRKSRTYANMKDSDMISSIIGNYAELTANISATATQWPEQVQHYATDWDFIIARSEGNGMIVATSDGKITAGKPDANTTSVMTVRYGDNLLAFNADLNSVTQLSEVSASTWDYETQARIKGYASNEMTGPGNLSSKKLSEVTAPDEYELQTTVGLESADLTNWAKAQIVKSEYSKIRGTVKFQGSDLARPGNYITIGGVGDRFNGDHLVSGVVHDISGGNWITEATIGLSTKWITEESDVMAPPASGLLPGARGLFNGHVKKIYEDPEGQYRILVQVPMFDENGEGIWARLSNIYATSGAGVFFIPEVGDEVVLGFLNEDPRYPIVLGSMYSSTKLKPFAGLEPNEKNSKKAIVSKSGIRITFDDDNKDISIETPGLNKIVISDKDKRITIADQNQNSIVMSEAGITISSPKAINLNADQNINVAGAQGVQVQASGGDVAIHGMNIKETADMQYSAQGSMTAQIQAGTELTLKGAMININ